MFLNYSTLMAKYNITEKKEKTAAYRSLISPQLMDEFEEKILNLVFVQKKYRLRDYSAKKLAEDIGTNTRYISAVVNMRFHMNYKTYVNKCRVEEARSLLVDQRYQHLKMEEIGMMVGFSNRQSFYAAFFRFLGMPPCDYRHQHFEKHPLQKKVEKKKERKTKKS